jgi:hypothetical protein
VTMNNFWHSTLSKKCLNSTGDMTFLIAAMRHNRERLSLLWIEVWLLLERIFCSTYLLIRTMNSEFRSTWKTKHNKQAKAKLKSCRWFRRRRAWLHGLQLSICWWCKCCSPPPRCRLLPPTIQSTRRTTWCYP